MAKLTLRQQITEAEGEVEDLKRAYLYRFGWSCSSNTPGAYWLWRRDFADLDAQRAKWDKAHDAGKPGKPSISPPYGVITAPTDLAVSITQSALDEEIDQDGDPETPAITAADFAEDE